MGTTTKPWKFRKAAIALAVVFGGFLLIVGLTPTLMKTQHYASVEPILVRPIDLPKAKPPMTVGPIEFPENPPVESTPVSLPAGGPMEVPNEIPVVKLGIPSEGPAAPSSTRTLDEEIRGLEWGETAFDAPQEMAKGRPYKATLSLSLSLTASQLIEAMGGDTGSVRTARARVTDAMEAALTGYGFSIQATTPELQVVSGYETTTWSWEVVPMSSGTLALHLSLSAFLKEGRRQVPLVVRTLDKSITVRVSAHQAFSAFIKSNWQWLWATILAPLAAMAWGFRKHGKKKRKPIHRG